MRLTGTSLIVVAMLAIVAAPADARSAPDLTSVAASAGSFDTLGAALKRTGLDRALRGDGPFTVFAPTDGAFSRMPASLRPVTDSQLRRVLLDHVVAGRIEASTLLLTRTVTTLGGTELPVRMRDGRLTVGGSPISRVDVSAGNGVIHVLDAVIATTSSSPDGVEEILTLAIDRGAPLYNHGSPEGCAAVYEVAARAAVSIARGENRTDHLAVLEEALMKAAKQRDAGDRAWTLRRAFDRIFASREPSHSEATKPAPARAVPASFVREASLPAGFPMPGPLGEVVAKEYPRYRLARAAGGMWAFGTLFGHIKKNDIAMTAPVEMTMEAKDDGRLEMRDMAFLYASTDLGETGRQGRVEVADLEPMTVLSVSLHGPLSKDRIRAVRAAIEKRLGESPAWRRAGEWRVMGYNSPMVPEKRRLYEIQLPVAPSTDG